jgi:hypothetical protein
MTNDASMAGLAGAVRVRRYGEVTLHSYVAPEEGLLVNTQIVEGPTKLVIFDGQYFLRYAAEAAVYARSLGKPVDPYGQKIETAQRRQRSNIFGLGPVLHNKLAVDA